MKPNLFIIIILFVGLISSTLNAQQTIPTTGGNGSNSTGSISYSVGQIGYTTVTNSKGSIAQGVQHAYEISVVSGIEDSKNINLVVSAYPNPTIDFLHLQIQNYTNSNMRYQLFDLNGKIIRTQDIEYSVTRISMASLATSTYFLRVLDDGNTIKIFKIIKQ